MRPFNTVLLLSFIFSACTAPPTFIRTSTEPIGTSIHVNTATLDELNCEPGWPTSPAEIVMLMTGCSGAPNGSCSWLEANAAAQANRAVDTCPAGVPPAMGQDAIYLDVAPNIGRQFNISESVSILGDVNAPTSLTLGGRSRLYFGNGNAPHLELSGVRCTGGCPHGGNCLADAPGDVAQGGCVYMLVPGWIDVHDSMIDHNTARTGGGIDLCTTTPGMITFDNVTVEDNIGYAGGGAGIEMHGPNSATITDSFFRRNHARGSDQTSGGAIKLNGGTMTVTNTIIEDNVSEMGIGGGVAVGGPGSSAINQNAIVLTMIGGALRRNIANGNGGDAWVQAGSDGVSVANNYCPTGGCLLVLRDVEVTDGTADSPTSWPPGNGGLLATNNSGAHPGTIRLEGSTTLSGGVDLTAPSYPQTYGLIDDQRSMSVCGNSIVEPGEQCDGGACCAPTCQFRPDGYSCSDGNACNGTETCMTGACSGIIPACGNGVLETACGEECDDGNTTPHDGCRADCSTEVCTCE